MEWLNKRKASRNMKRKFKKRKERKKWQSMLSFKITFQDSKNGKRQKKKKIIQLPRPIELSSGNIVIFSDTAGAGIFVSYISGIKIFFTELTRLPEYFSSVPQWLFLPFLITQGQGRSSLKAEHQFIFSKDFLEPLFLSSIFGSNFLLIL